VAYRLSPRGKSKEAKLVVVPLEKLTIANGPLEKATIASDTQEPVDTENASL
jgi:hypothetical protein